MPAAKALLYRALISGDHVDRWRRGEHSSFHHVSPGEWLVTWRETRSLDERDYTLKVRLGTHTSQARRAFLEAAPKYRDDQVWDFDDLKSASELAGVCAFTDGLAAYNYGRPGRRFLVAFRGDILGPAPEDNGVVATVEIIEHGPINPDAFLARHGLEPAPDSQCS